MPQTLGKYIGTITGTSGASGTIDVSAYPLSFPVWVQPRADNGSDVRIVPGATASNSAGSTFGVQFAAGQLFPICLVTTSLAAIATDGASTIHVDVFER